MNNQLPLFPLDPWGAEHAVTVFDTPYPGIARAMLGPVVPGFASDADDSTLKCLAVAEHGQIVSMLRLKDIDFQNMGSVWCQVTHALDVAGSPEVMGSTAIANDCFLHWSSLTAWVSPSGYGDSFGPAVHAVAKLITYLEFGTLRPCEEDQVRIEKKALIDVSSQVTSAVLHVLGMLGPEILEIVTTRPRMSIPMACQLLAIAKRHSPTAVKYTLQALRTESFGMLNMITSSQPQDVALQIRETIFNGNSLPDALQKIGITKATHRQTLIKPAQHHEATTDKLALGELPLSGRDWIFSMQLTKHLPLHSQTDWDAFGRLVEQLRSAHLLRFTLAPMLLKWCSRPSWKDSNSRLAYLVEQAKTLVTASKSLAGFDLPTGVAITYFIDVEFEDGKGYMRTGECRHINLDPKNMAHLVMFVAHVSGQKLSCLLHAIFVAQPTLPPGYQMAEFTRIKPLNSLDLAMAHGLACRNCLTHLETVVHYVTSGVGIYAVYSASGVMGTIALGLNCSDIHPRIVVKEVTGLGNELAGIDLRRWAQSLADAWSAVPMINQWIDFDAQSKALRLRCTQPM